MRRLLLSLYLNHLPSGLLYRGSKSCYGHLARLKERHICDSKPLALGSTHPPWNINLLCPIPFCSFIKKKTNTHKKTYKCDVVIVFAFLDWVTWQAFVSSDSKKSSRALAGVMVKAKKAQSLHTFIWIKKINRQLLEQANQKHTDLLMRKKNIQHKKHHWWKLRVVRVWIRVRLLFDKV